ncbi:MAG TPA: fluoride efflux transporter CrcB [Gammaproteobacteria bacterium]|nr:fluoride efflux transporter CrcB [Gammaproteobacteria bacterium]
MTEALVIAAGGALGALARFWSANFVTQILGAHFPYGILLVNVVGSCLIGVAFVLLVEKASADTLWRPFIIVGVLGAFTTFSTFSLQALDLLEAGRTLAAAAYVAGSVVLCLVGIALGVAITRAFN